MMITPRLTDCAECVDILALQEQIDCKIANLASCAYNKIIYGMNTECSGDTMFALLNYRRILLYRYFNPMYASKYSLYEIASRVKILVAGTKCNCVKKEAIFDASLFVIFPISSASVECCSPPGPGYQALDTYGYHNGDTYLPESGDIVYTDPDGLFPFPSSGPGETRYTVPGPGWLHIGDAGEVLGNDCNCPR